MSLMSCRACSACMMTGLRGAAADVMNLIDDKSVPAFDDRVVYASSKVTGGTRYTRETLWAATVLQNSGSVQRGMTTTFARL